MIEHSLLVQQGGEHVRYQPGRWRVPSALRTPGHARLRSRLPCLSGHKLWRLVEDDQVRELGPVNEACLSFHALEQYRLGPALDIPLPDKKANLHLWGEG